MDVESSSDAQSEEDEVQSGNGVSLTLENTEGGENARRYPVRERRLPARLADYNIDV